LKVSTYAYATATYKQRPSSDMQNLLVGVESLQLCFDSL